MSATSPNPLALEKACIQKTQAALKGMLQNVEGLEMLNRVHARLEEEIRDACLALETVARLRAELWASQRENFEKAESITEVGGTL